MTSFASKTGYIHESQNVFRMGRHARLSDSLVIMMFKIFYFKGHYAFLSKTDLASSFSLFHKPQSLFQIDKIILIVIKLLTSIKLTVYKALL